MGKRRFDAFVLFAEMRTGSNYLQDRLNALPDVICYGEVFNPHFIGQHNRFDLFDYDMDRREADPVGLLDAIMAQSDGLPGFRFFHDHDPRVVARVVPDPRIAKVILTRNPLDSYVSAKIAIETDQWRMVDARKLMTARIRFDTDEFLDLLTHWTAFQRRLRHGLQIAGQTAFQLRYEDISDPDVLDGLAGFLGSTGCIPPSSSRLKKQNPQDLTEKIVNYDEMLDSLRDLDRFGVTATHEHEPPQPPVDCGVVAHPGVGLMFLPIPGAPDSSVLDWMGAIGGVGRGALLRLTHHKDLQHWRGAHPGHRGFTILRHPVARAYNSFSRFILPKGNPAYLQLRKMIRQRYKLPIPTKTPGPDWTAEAQKTAFAAFLGFLKINLAGQTSLHVDAAWASQRAILQGVAPLMTPHHLIHEGDMARALPDLACAVGVEHPPAMQQDPIPSPFPLGQIYDETIEQAARVAYRRDYLDLGFRNWTSG